MLPETYVPFVWDTTRIMILKDWRSILDEDTLRFIARNIREMLGEGVHAAMYALNWDTFEFVNDKDARIVYSTTYNILFINGQICG